MEDTQSVAERLYRIDRAIRTLVWLLVGDLSGFTGTDAVRVERIIDGDED